jgi:hypothetical protein
LGHLAKADSKRGIDMSQKELRVAVVGIDVFEAISAFLGAVGLVVGFMNIPVTILSGTVFADFTVPALLLGFVVGGSALVAALAAAFGSPRYGGLASMMAGCITVGWLSIEIAMIGLDSWAQVAWWLVGAVMIVLGAFLWHSASYVAGGAGSRQPA